MSLPRRLMVSIAGLALLSCDGTWSLKPKPLTSRVYQLVGVSGHTLPVDVFSGPIETYTALRETLTLFSNDSSEATVLARDSLPAYGVSTSSFTRFGEYRVSGDSIETGYFGHCRDICSPNRIGMFSDTAVTLTQELSVDYPVYVYRLVPFAH